MSKRAFITLSELAVWVVIVAVVASGCGERQVAADPSKSADPSETPVTTEAPVEDPSNSTPAASAAPNDAANKESNMAASLSDIPLIPRNVLFGNPERAQARLSPDGKWISYLAPVRDGGEGEGVMNVWVAPADNLKDAKQVTDDKDRGIRGHSWAYNSQQIVYTQDVGGDENWHVYATNVETNETIDLTPIDGVNARVMGSSEKFPNEVLIGLNDRNPRLHDIYRVDLRTGKRELLQENPGFAALLADDDFKVRLAFTYTPDGGQSWLIPKGESGKQGYKDWDVKEQIGSEDALTSGPAGFDKTGEVLYYEDSRKRNTSALFSQHLETGETKLLAEDDKADVGGALSHPTEKNIQAVSFTYARREWKILDDAIKGDIDFLTDFADGEFEVTGRTLDDQKWTVAYILDDGPVKYYIYHRDREGQERMEYLFANRDDLEQYPLVKMHSPVVKSRDGLELVCYLSLPPGSDPDGDGVPDKPVPMVLDVHGGPWARDGWGYNPSHQWLANRGYAVLNVNYRGSTGFGKEFINASAGEWSGKMHDDLIDAVKWAVEQGIAVEEKVCIMGGSYGGYATLVGMTFTPDAFACGVDIVGPSSLVTLLQNVPPYWGPFMPVMKNLLGDHETEEGVQQLLEKSPLTLVDRIKRPLLIGQGANDPRVTQVEADQIVEAMTEKGIPVTYVLYPDEGHGFARPENRMSFNAVTEAFLAKQLGGRFEEIGDDFQGASIHVPAGADEVPGVKEQLSEERLAMPPKEAEAESGEESEEGGEGEQPSRDANDPAETPEVPETQVETPGS